MRISDNSRITVDSVESVGPVRAIHGVNLGPLVDNGVNTNDHSKYFSEIAFPTVRLHDVPFSFRQSVDVPCIFPLFHLDPHDPRNYDFRRTDVYIRSIVECGCGIVYRLGVQIERAELNFDTDPPADVDKWIEVCANIIRHYNYGWANGFEYGIKYWEIWNEPDNGPGQWNGTFEEFTAFYIKVTSQLKALFPELMIGGPALNGGMLHSARQKLDEFLPHVRKAGAPLDFLSWHAYPADGDGNAGDQVRAVAGDGGDASAPREPDRGLAAFMAAARDVRKALDDYGFTATESHLNEWNLAPLKWGFQSPEAAAAYVAEKRGPINSSLITACLTALQDMPVDMSNFYTAARRSYGIFDDWGRPFKPFYAFRAFKKVLDDTPIRCSVSGAAAETGGTVLAAKSAAGDVIQLLLANAPGRHPGQPWQPRICLRELPAVPVAVQSLVLDAEHDLAEEAAPAMSADGEVVLPMGPHTVRLLRIDFGERESP
ncbi:MAG: hypothetical protein HN742_32985 [Lentisphaerae bacterium]|jgi:xylan 1,4-beta-xylosidase|nr:hypothetical protein [Lentisphaerota bacterium]MBT4820773.1 hypothetical protein [Lentisphaerota bacterium]MBT5608239.1 hypothetical protein [Lentisphaerota bacterium]MBT7061175.1 hypothetical protein [Lentisphaerota bacterium]MBT7846733.1 hypothetical protein [Lentisphaerota bacterium]